MYSLEKMPYSYSALEPYIDTRIMELHHAGHQQAYVDGLNAALKKEPSLESIPLPKLIVDLSQVPESVRTAVRNHGGGVLNHTFFWECMTPKSHQLQDSSLLNEITIAFGGFDQFKEQFSSAAKTVFGSGWAWLCVDRSGKLVIVTTANQDSPLSMGLFPLLGLDVWEHAYYLQYLNKRVDYIAAWWHVVNWEKVIERYENVVK